MLSQTLLNLIPAVIVRYQGENTGALNVGLPFSEINDQLLERIPTNSVALMLVELLFLFTEKMLAIVSLR